MKKIHLTLLISFLAFMAVGCGEDDGGETSGGLNGAWQLSKITVNLDGSELTQIETTGINTSFSGETFSYTDGGTKSGSWSINEEETEITVNFDATSLTLPLVSKTDTEIVFTIKTIDLANSLTEDDEAMIRLINQNLILSRNSWREASAGAQTAAVNFTLIKQ